MAQDCALGSPESEKPVAQPLTYRLSFPMEMLVKKAGMENVAFRIPPFSFYCAIS